MMEKLKNSVPFLAIFALSFYISSCTESPDINSSESITTPTDYTSLLGIVDLDDIDVSTTQSDLKSVSESDYMPCFEVTVHENENSEFWPRSWTFTYSNEECTDCFGNTKLGSVHVLLTDFWKNKGSLRTITFEDFSINGNKLEGTRTILNTGFNDSLNLTFERDCQDASYSRADTATMYWESHRDVEMIAGYETFLAADDEYTVSGGATGTNFDQKPFTVTITEELFYKKCALFPVSGTILIEVEGESPIYINYGDGECDNIAEMTVDDITTEITLGNNSQCCN
jgi:hypothetical protein